FPTFLSSAVALAMALPAGAQWLDHKSPGIPRTKDGKPNLSAAAPKMPDGKPDLSGVWEHLNSRTTAYYLDGIDIPWQPWTAELHPELIPDTTLLESFCQENERDLRHLVGR